MASFYGSPSQIHGNASTDLNSQIFVPTHDCCRYNRSASHPAHYSYPNFRKERPYEDHGGLESQAGSFLVGSVRRFLAGEAGPQEGQKILGRWHAVDMSIGFTLSETEKPTAHYVAASKFADIMDLRAYPVLEDVDVAPILAAMPKG